MAYYVINYSKLRIWKFVEYSKLIYLDGDIQVYDNIDHLFDLPDGNFYAVMDCFCEQTWSHTPQAKIGYCQQCPDKVKWPAEMGQPPSLYFNAGMCVFEPGLETYENLLATLKVVPPTPFAEQDFLNMFFKDIYKPIPLVYNLVLAMLWRHPENVELDKVKVVHYCAAGSKPWRYTGKEENMQREDVKMLVQKWWDNYIDESLDYWNPTVGDGEAVEPVKMQPLLVALSEAGAVPYVTAPSAA
ncbi:Galactinol synthase 3 [Hibiscus syriacus]|uniref:Hexosyltransferase n=2 Tax=Hibiscus syriacus TaxID=106335 RepID=A0A6A2ZYA7_HIBSY|nr:Galactinol synthase 3 [Hibiscus syriacus]